MDCVTRKAVFHDNMQFVHRKTKASCIPLMEKSALPKTDLYFSCHTVEHGATNATVMGLMSRE